MSLERREDHCRGAMSYMDRMLDEHEKIHYQERNALLDTRKEMERRLEEMNQFREQINNERHSFVTRDMYDQRNQALADSVYQKIQSLQRFQWSVLGGLTVFQSLIIIILHFWR
jgi:hypothetical protein